MKKILLSLLFIAAAGPAFAQQFVAPMRRVPAARTTTVLPARPTEGSLQRGVRNGNPLQLLNPFAPRQYGSGADFVNTERDPFQRPPGGIPRPTALRLLAFEF